ncbi:MAG: methyltransferase domain-containing protein [Bacteroidetes bacterium]|nr:MAG: methyltransferase domain-containing protein [Bacteroidota bacterium]
MNNIVKYFQTKKSKLIKLNSKMENHQKCLVCQHNNFSVMQNYEHAFLQKCNSCGFVFCSKIPTQSELIAHYNGYSRQDDISPITIKRYEELLENFEKYRKTNRIIDIGCGNGHFLKVAQKKGWQVYGTEFTDEAIKKCEEKNIQMQQGILNPANYEADFFDIITSFEVLEHINNPIEEVKNFKQILRKNGLIYLTTPNFDSLSRLYLKQSWTVIEYPEHLSYYTVKTLKQLFENQGFKTKKISTTGISIGRIQQDATQEKTEEFRQKDEKLRQKTEKNPLLQIAKNSINALLDMFNKGDTLKVFFEKKS